MTPSTIRAELVAQHDELRKRIVDARAIVAGCLRNGAGPVETHRGELHRAVLHVADMLRLHNQREEELMRDVLPTLDAWGSVRKDVMLEEHVVEHGETYAALMKVAAGTNLRESAATASELFDLVVGHLEREEKIFLGTDLLSDTGVPPDSFGG